MKKINLLTIVTVLMALLLTSCNNYKAKEVELKNLNDSINYTLGLSNGNGIKDYYMQNDSTNKDIAAFIKAIDKAFNNKTETDELYKIGQQIGNSILQMEKSGFYGDSTILINRKAIVQGIINGINNFDKGMNADQADEYIRNAMNRKQELKMKEQLQSNPIEENEHDHEDEVDAN